MGHLLNKSVKINLPFSSFLTSSLIFSRSSGSVGSPFELGMILVLLLLLVCTEAGIYNCPVPVDSVWPLVDNAYEQVVRCTRVLRPRCQQIFDSNWNLL